MSLLKNYIKSTASNYLYVFVSMLSLFILIRLLIHQLGTKQLGIYLIFITTSNIMALGIGWLTGASIKLFTDAIVKKDESLSDLYSVILFGYFAYGLIIFTSTCIATTLFGTYFFTAYPAYLIADIQHSTILLGLYVWLIYINNANVNYLTAMLKQTQINFISIFSQILFIAFAVTFIQVKQSITAVMLALVIATLVKTLLTYFYTIKYKKANHIKLTFAKRETYKKVFLQFGRKYFVFGALQMLILYSDVYIVGLVLGTTAVAIYTIIWKIPQAYSMLSSRLIEVLAPFITRTLALDKKKQVRIYYFLTMRLQIWLAMLGAIIYIIAGPVLLQIWVGSQHTPIELKYYYLAAFVAFIQMLNKQDELMHYASGDVNKIALPMFLEITSKVILTIILAQFVGVLAPFYAYLTTQLLFLTWVYRLKTMRLFNIRAKSWWNQIGTCLTLGIVIIFASSYFASNIWQTTNLYKAVAGIIFALSCVLIVFAFEYKKKFTFISLMKPNLQTRNST